MANETTTNPQSRADELEERLIDFAVRIVRLSAGLPGRPPENTSRDKFYEPVHRQLQTMVKREVLKAAPILSTSWGLYSRNSTKRPSGFALSNVAKY